MPETNQPRVPTAEAYFSTTYVLGTGSTSTPVLRVWRTLNRFLVDHRLPMTGQQLADATGLSLEEIEQMFNQVYYQRSYGFRRYDSLAEWEQFAAETGLLYIPELHDPKPEAEGQAADAAAESAPEAEQSEQS